MCVQRIAKLFLNLGIIGAIEELFLQITQTLVGRKFDTERQRYLKQTNPVMIQETPAQSSSCCGV
jgi:hypothetical protein